MQEVFIFPSTNNCYNAPNEYYIKNFHNQEVRVATEKLIALCDQFEEILIKRGQRARLRKKKFHRFAKSDSSSTSSSELNCNRGKSLLDKQAFHSDRLHPQLLFNVTGKLNDKPKCSCSANAKCSGINHNIYVGEHSIGKCNDNSNNAGTLYHYRITISPETNLKTSTPTVICHENNVFTFDGFSMLSHKPLGNLPGCKVIRSNIEYTISFVEDEILQNFTIRELDLFHEFFFKEILELVDLDFKPAGNANGCPQFHFIPRFICESEKFGSALSMNIILGYILDSSKLLTPMEILSEINELPHDKWQNQVKKVKGMVVTHPGQKPCSIRVDQLNKTKRSNEKLNYPQIVHFNKNQPIVISSEGFYKTGIMCDIVQHAMFIPVLASHLRFHQSLNILEHKLNYKFNDKSLLILALTQQSYRGKFGINRDHCYNSLRNCGMRLPKYGSYKMSSTNKLPKLSHNKRLGFLGDAVIEFVTSIHLFHMWPNHEQNIAHYRGGIVNNKFILGLAKTLGLDGYMLYAHNSYFGQDLGLEKAMAHCFEALIGALFLDGGIEVADKVFSEVVLSSHKILCEVWKADQTHTLQRVKAYSDTQSIVKSGILKILVAYENMIGVKFTHIRLLDQTFTLRSIGHSYLARRSNEKLVFLGYSALRFIASEYLYKSFPEYHERQLYELRCSLLHHATFAELCGDLASYKIPKIILTIKDQMDLTKAVLGSLYLDKGLDCCQVFCKVCFFPRLEIFYKQLCSNDECLS